MNGKMVRQKNRLDEKNLPAMFFFTDRKRFDDIFSVISKLPQNSAIIIREYDLNFKEKLDFARKILKITKLKNIKVFVGKDVKLAKKIKADGIHFSDLDKNIKLAKIPKNILVSYSCHNEKSLALARKIKADLVFLSPIFKTESHPNQKPIGTYLLRKFARQNELPTYALGGINDKNVKLLKGSLISGIGGISIFN